MRVSTSVVEGLLLLKTAPPYPAIARATRTEGTVVLEATISKAGAIENLRAVSGPPLLRQAAVDAVKTWRYRPYLLDGQPIDVETTVNVIFSLQ
jgi:protein TonB